MWCAANTAQAVWRGKDKPTPLVRCFYDLLTARQYFLPTVTGSQPGWPAKKTRQSSNMVMCCLTSSDVS